MAGSQAKGDFGTGSITKHILRLALPVMAAEAVHVLYNIVDRMYIGHIPDTGTIALTGIGVAFPLVTLIGAFANLFAMGGSPLASIARGAGNNEKAERITESAFAMLVYVGAILTVLLFIFCPTLLELFGGDEETLPYALDYFKVYVIGTIPTMITLGMNMYITSQGFATTGMLSTVIGAVINIALDPIFIFNMELGVKGAAYATVISQIASAIWVSVFLWSKKPIAGIKHFRISKEEVGPMLKLGITGFTFKVTNSITQAVTTASLKAFAGAMSTDYIASMTIINSLREVTSIPINAATNGFQPVLSYNYGAKDYPRVNECMRTAFKIALVVNTAIWAVLQIFPKYLIAMFTDELPLIELTLHCSRIFFAVFPIMTLQLMGQNTFVSLNKPKLAVFFSLLRKLFLIVPLMMLLPRIGFGVDGVFLAETCSQALGGIATFTTMYVLIWRKIKKRVKEGNSGENNYEI